MSTSTSPASTVLSVSGMTCRACATRVRAAASELPGVHSVDIDLASGRASVRFEPGASTPAAIAAAIAGAGYPATPVSAGSTPSAAPACACGWD